MRILSIFLGVYTIISVMVFTGMNSYPKYVLETLIAIMLLMSTVVTPSFVMRLARKKALKELKKEYLDFFNRILLTENPLDRRDFLRLKKYIHDDGVNMLYLNNIYLLLAHSPLRQYDVDEELIDVFIKNASREELANLLAIQPKKVVDYHKIGYARRRYLNLVEKLNVLQDFDIKILKKIQEGALEEYTRTGFRSPISLYNEVRSILEQYPTK